MLIWTKDLIEDVLDSPAADDHGQLLVEPRTAGFESRQGEAFFKCERPIGKHRVWQLPPFYELPLISRFLH